MNTIISFKDLREKQVINASNGEFIGCISDLEFDRNNGDIKFFSVKLRQKKFSLKCPETVKFSYNDIEQIGEDIIVVSYFCTCKNNNSN